MNSIVFKLDGFCSTYSSKISRFKRVYGHIRDHCDCPPSCQYAEDSCLSDPCTCPVICRLYSSTPCELCRVQRPTAEFVHSYDEQPKEDLVEFGWRNICNQCARSMSVYGRLAHLFGGVYQSIIDMCVIPRDCTPVDPLLERVTIFALDIANATSVDAIDKLFSEPQAPLYRDYVNSPVMDWLFYALASRNQRRLWDIWPSIKLEIPPCKIPMQFFYFTFRLDYVLGEFTHPSSFILKHAESPIEVIDLFETRYLATTPHTYVTACYLVRALQQWVRDLPRELAFPVFSYIRRSVRFEALWQDAWDVFGQKLFSDNFSIWSTIAPDLGQFFFDQFDCLSPYLRGSPDILSQILRTAYQSKTPVVPDSLRFLLDAGMPYQSSTTAIAMHTLFGGNFAPWRTFWRWLRDRNMPELATYVLDAFDGSCSAQFILFASEELGFDAPVEHIRRLGWLTPPENIDVLIGLARILRRQTTDDDVLRVILRICNCNSSQDVRGLVSIVHYVLDDNVVDLRPLMVYISRLLFEVDGAMIADDEAIELLQRFWIPLGNDLASVSVWSTHMEKFAASWPRTYDLLVRHHIDELITLSPYLFDYLVTSENAVRLMIQRIGGPTRARAKWPLRVICSVAGRARTMLCFRAGLYSEQCLRRELLFGRHYHYLLMCALDIDEFRDNGAFWTSLFSERRFQVWFWLYVSWTSDAIKFFNATARFGPLPFRHEVLAQFSNTTSILHYTFDLANYRITETQHRALINEAEYPSRWPRASMVVSDSKKRPAPDSSEIPPSKREKRLDDPMIIDD